MIGTTIDGIYRVERMIGEGGFGIVYECTDLELGRPVALKLLHHRRTGERELQRFTNECRNLASLNHPNVVHIYRIGTHENVPFMVMEYLRGRTLRALVRAEAVTLPRAIAILRQAALGLHAIHSTGILHRDLSLNNVMVSDDDTAKILDLGLSRYVDSYTSQNNLAGTLAYVAPEQASGGVTSVTSEVFSFGVMLYEVLTGRNPFWSELPSSLLYNIVHRAPEPIETRLSHCPPVLSALVSHCLEKTPEQRPRSMVEVVAALAEVLGTLDVSTAATSAIATGPVTSSRSGARNPYVNRVMLKRREDFYGRRQEVVRIFSRLSSTPPGSVSIVGDSKSGKSSLLHYVYSRQTRQEHLEQPDRMIMVFLDLQEEKDMSLASFVDQLVAIANFELHGRVQVADCTRDLDGAKDLVRRLDTNGFRLTILLDGFDIVTRNSNFDLAFFSILRFLANHYNVAYVTSSTRALQTFCHTKEIADSPFFNIFSVLRLTALQRNEAMELVCTPSALAGHPLEPVADDILEMAGLFPLFLQMACCHAVEWMIENPAAASPDLDEVRRRFCAEAEFHFRYIWEHFDVREQSAIRRVAEHKEIPDALGYVVQELHNKRYVEVAGERGPRLFGAAFSDFIRGAAARQAAPGLLGRILGRRR